MYREKRPENMMADDAPFYLGINFTKKDCSRKKLVHKSAPMHGSKKTKLFDENDGFESKH